MTKADEAIVEGFARGSTSGNVAAFQVSEATKERVGDLIRRSKNEGLSDQDAAELEDYLRLEHLMRMAKARAKQHLAT